jgi:hypothetical protein
VVRGGFKKKNQRGGNKALFPGSGKLLPARSNPPASLLRRIILKSYSFALGAGQKARSFILTGTGWLKLQLLFYSGIIPS